MSAELIEITTQIQDENFALQKRLEDTRKLLFKAHQEIKSETNKELYNEIYNHLHSFNNVQA